MKLNYQSRILSVALMLVFVVIMLVAALFFPKTQRNVDVVDVLLILDITQSMDVVDVVDVADGDDNISRLTWAKQFAHQTLNDLPCGSHAGLAVFSEARSLILINPVEVYSNYHDLSLILNKINGPMAWALSSELSKASFTAINQAKLMTPKPGLIFITDGHEAPPLSKTLYPKFKGTLGEISGVFVGIGGDVLKPIPKHDMEGNDLGFWEEYDVVHEDVYTSLQDDAEKIRSLSTRTEHLSSQKKDHLKVLAERVGFDYISMPESTDDALDLLAEKMDVHQNIVAYSWAPWFAGIALFLLFLIYTPYRVFLRRRA